MGSETEKYGNPHRRESTVEIPPDQARSTTPSDGLEAGQGAERDARPLRRLRERHTAGRSGGTKPVANLVFGTWRPSHYPSLPTRSEGLPARTEVGYPRLPQ